MSDTFDILDLLRAGPNVRSTHHSVYSLAASEIDALRSVVRRASAIDNTVTDEQDFDRWVFVNCPIVNDAEADALRRAVGNV